MPLTPGMTCSSVVVSTPSVSVFDDGSPSRGLSKVVGDGVRRLSMAAAEGNEEKEDWVDVGMSLTSPGRCRVVELQPQRVVATRDSKTTSRKCT